MTDATAGPHEQGSPDQRAAASVQIPVSSDALMGIDEGVD